MKRQPQGISLHVGLNRVDPEHYAGWSGELRGCHADAGAMAAIAKVRGYDPHRLLLDDQATVEAVRTLFRTASSLLEKGDTLLFTFAGHGGQVPDLDGDESDAMDETLCLWDRQWVDDEIHAEIARFRPGVRILIIADSCHSGTVARSARDEGEKGYRLLPPGRSRACYRQHRATYDAIQRGTPGVDASRVRATAILLAACQDNQLAADGPDGGLFTATLRQVWRGGRWKGATWRFRDAIAQRMPPWQTPHYYVVGHGDPKFEAQPPFTI
ncbi:MAG: caspase family protein [Verrucomicrobiae bacterium]|nr:caspase family protein [Verrucomicrobiae bacterium]